MKKYLSSRIQLRCVPQITFKIDGTFAEVDKIGKLLRCEKVALDLQKKDDDEDED